MMISKKQQKLKDLNSSKVLFKKQCYGIVFWKKNQLKIIITL